MPIVHNALMPFVPLTISSRYFPYKELRALVDFTKKVLAKDEGTALTAAASARR